MLWMAWPRSINILDKKRGEKRKNYADLGQPDGSPHPVSKLDCLDVQVTDLVL